MLSVIKSLDLARYSIKKKIYIFTIIFILLSGVFPCTATGILETIDDKTPPTISFYGAHPSIQLKNNMVEIRCITIDFSGIQSVEMTIRSPDNLSKTYTMSNISHDTKYTYTQHYWITGKYVYSITVKDNKGNKKITDEKTFWITNDLNDTDDDGMSNTWEYA